MLIQNSSGENHPAVSQLLQHVAEAQQVLSYEKSLYYFHRAYKVELSLHGPESFQTKRLKEKCLVLYNVIKAQAKEATERLQAEQEVSTTTSPTPEANLLLGKKRQARNVTPEKPIRFLGLG